jgi:hypothetical protein
MTTGPVLKMLRLLEREYFGERSPIYGKALSQTPM